MPRSPVQTDNIVAGAAVAVNGRTSFSKEFPLGQGWYALKLRLSVALTIGTGASPVTEGILNFLRQIYLRTDRGEIIVDNLPARSLYKIAAYKQGSPPRKDEIAAANGTYRFDIPIWFVDQATMRPEDTVLDTTRYQAIYLDLVTGPLSDLLGTVGTAAAVVTADIDYLHSRDEWPSSDAPPIGYVNYSARPPVDAAGAVTIDLEHSFDLSLKRLFVHTSTSGTAGMPWYGVNSDAIINQLNVRNGQNQYAYNRTWAMLQDQNKDEASLETVLAGVGVVDYVNTDRSLKSALYTGDKGQLQLAWSNQGGVGANSIVTAVQEGYRTLKQKAAA